MNHSTPTPSGWSEQLENDIPGDDFLAPRPDNEVKTYEGTSTKQYVI
jgi:hypothetical protein